MRNDLARPSLYAARYIPQRTLPAQLSSRIAEQTRELREQTHRLAASLPPPPPPAHAASPRTAAIEIRALYEDFRAMAERIERRFQQQADFFLELGAGDIAVHQRNFAFAGIFAESDFCGGFLEVLGRQWQVGCIGIAEHRRHRASDADAGIERFAHRRVIQRIGDGAPDMDVVGRRDFVVELYVVA